MVIGFLFIIEFDKNFFVVRYLFFFLNRSIVIVRIMMILAMFFKYSLVYSFYCFDIERKVKG